jgi:hypothetical protein
MRGSTCYSRRFIRNVDKAPRLRWVICAAVFDQVLELKLTDPSNKSLKCLCQSNYEIGGDIEAASCARRAR